jgi:GTP-binding protein
MPKPYTRYLENVFRKAFKWVGTPVIVEYRVGENPYDPNAELTQKERQRKQRVSKFAESRKTRDLRQNPRLSRKSK